MKSLLLLAVIFAFFAASADEIKAIGVNREVAKKADSLATFSRDYLNILSCHEDVKVGRGTLHHISELKRNQEPHEEVKTLKSPHELKYFNYKQRDTNYSEPEKILPPDSPRVSSLRPCADIYVNQITPADTAIVLNGMVVCKEEIPGEIYIFLNGHTIFRRTPSDKDISGYKKNQSFKFNIELSSYFKSGFAKWDAENHVEIDYVGPQLGDVTCNSLNFDFTAKKRELPQLVIPIGHTVAVSCMGLTADGKYLFTGSADGYIKKWDVAAQIELKTIKVADGGVISLDVSNDGAYVRVVGQTRLGDFMSQGYSQQDIWDVEADTILKIKNRNYSPLDRTFTADGKGIIFMSSNEIYDFRSKITRPFIDGLPFTKMNAIELSQDNNIGLISGEANGKGKLILWDFRLNKELNNFAVDARLMQINPSGKSFLAIDYSGGNGRVRFFYWKDGNKKPKQINVEKDVNVTKLSLSPDDKFFTFTDNHHQTYLYDLRAEQFLPDSALISKQTYLAEFLRFSNRLFVTDLYGRTNSYELPGIIPDKTFKGQLNLMTDFGMNIQGNRLFMASRAKKDGFIFSFKPGEPMAVMHHDSRFEEFNISPDNKYLISRGKKGPGYLWDLKNTILKTKYDFGDSIVKSLFWTDGRLLLMPGNIINGKYKPVVVDATTGKVDSNFNDNNWGEYYTDADNTAKGKIYPEQVKTGVNRTDGIINIRDSQTHVLLAHFVPFISGDWVLFTDDGYFMSSKDGARQLYYTFKSKIYTFDQFDLQYNRPDIVLERLRNTSADQLDIYRQLYRKRLKRMGYDIENFRKEKLFSAPVITLLQAPADSVVFIKTIHLNISIKDSLSFLNRLNVYVNGVPVFGIDGIDLFNRQTKQLEYPIDLTLSNGNNLIEISAINRQGVLSFPSQLEVDYKGIPAKPKLYVIAIGSGAYRNRDMNLTYAAKDARDIIDLFKTQKSASEDIIPVLLTDDSVSIRNINKVRKLLAGSSVDDRVILFFAGHGLITTSKDYYLATYDVDFNVPQKAGYPYPLFERLLDSIPARKKTMWVDACFSGEFDKDEMAVSTTTKATKERVVFRSAGESPVKNITASNDATFELLKDSFVDIKKNSGTTVISAAGGYESAIEDSEWHNGVFTYCLIRGLKNMEADLNHDGKVTISELEKYLEEKVFLLTNGLQRPTSRVENIDNDFVIWN